MYGALAARVRYHIQKANFMGLKDAESTLLLEETADAIEELICEVATEHNARLDAEERQRWIPVTERLPESDTNVLVKSGSFVSVWSLRKDSVYWEDEYGYFHYMCEITHWMPLPEPPKEET